jgi:hypothetical protein
MTCVPVPYVIQPPFSCPDKNTQSQNSLESKDEKYIQYGTIFSSMITFKFDVIFGSNFSLPSYFDYSS